MAKALFFEDFKYAENKIFNSPFETIKSLEYLINLINSNFINHFPEFIFKFSCKVLDRRVITSVLKKDPRIKEPLGDIYDIERCNLTEDLLIRIIKEDISPLAHERMKKVSAHGYYELTRRLSYIQNTFKLTDEEIDILVFVFLQSTCRVLSGLLCERIDSFDFSSFTTLRNYGNLILGQSRKAFITALSKNTMFDAYLLEKDRVARIEVSPWCANYLLGMGNDKLAFEFFQKTNDIHLDVNDFDNSEEEMLIIYTLMRSKKPFNILFYGAQGTGKTSLAKSLAKKYNRDLLSVNIPKSDDHRDRLRAIVATINLADRNNFVILIDEADDILNTSHSFFSMDRSNKSWINNLLENHNKKIIWITNRTSSIEPSTMRRFSFSMEFKKFTPKGRLHVLKHELKMKGLDSYFNDRELRDICKSYSVDASGIVNAINILNVKKKHKRETVLKMVETVLKNHEKATYGESISHLKKKEFKNYSLKGLNTSHDLQELISTLYRHAELQDRGKAKNSKALLLYGPPGTGKTEFVHYLGNEIGKEVVLKRCSEIQSMWVGVTEKNIAHAFQEAQESNNILFFDEADSFLYPRSLAERSWEKSFTNEILAQLDSFTGIVIFATNDIEGLDHAAMRRFKFKVEFRSLTPEGNLHFYETLLKPLASDRKDISEEEINEIKDIKMLTPGDFAVVQEQFALVDPGTITYRKLIDALLNETVYRKAEKKIVGFGQRE